MERLKDIGRGLRNTFWPIYGKENIKFLALLLMMCSSIFCYSILRILKDTYILSAPLATANSISFIKVYFVLPISVLYMMFFCHLTNITSKERVFFLSTIPLVLFFSLFYLFLYPNIACFHASVETVKAYQEAYPSLKNFIPVIGYWLFSIFYVAAELVGTVVITFLFWSFATYCVLDDEVQRFFPLFATYSYAIFMVASLIQKKVFNNAKAFAVGSKEYADAIFINFYLIVGSLILFLVLYYVINHYILNDEKHSKFSKDFKLEPKKKASFSDSMSTILTSKYLMSIVVVIICYGVSSNLMEVTWKEIIRKEFNGHGGEIGAYFSDFYLYTGIFTIVIGFLNKAMLARFGWFFATASVPLLLFFSSFLFFGLIVFESYIPSWVLCGFTASAFAMKVGFYQDNLTKSGRYAILDTNIQMVYLPLDDELKLKGKAAVDIIGSRVGKSMGSFLESSLSMLFRGADQLALAPIFMPFVLISCGLWAYAVFYLSNVYKALLKEKYSEVVSDKNENN